LTLYKEFHYLLTLNEALSVNFHNKEADSMHEIRNNRILKNIFNLKEDAVENWHRPKYTSAS